MTAFWKSVLSVLIGSALLAGASGLILTNVTAAEVANIKERVEGMDARHMEDAKKVERIDEKIAATKESVERIEQKLDRLLERQDAR